LQEILGSQRPIVIAAKRQFTNFSSAGKGLEVECAAPCIEYRRSRVYNQDAATAQKVRSDRVQRRDALANRVNSKFIGRPPPSASLPIHFLRATHRHYSLGRGFFTALVGASMRVNVSLPVSPLMSNLKFRK
jgi:hypothetical protein